MKRSNLRLEFSLPASFSPVNLSVELGKSGHSSDERRASVKLSYFYDTFDWRLFKKNLLLVDQRDGCYLYRYDNGRPLAFQASKADGKMKFLGDFSDGPLRELLTPIIEMRVLLPLLALSTKSHPWEARNRDDKIVLRWQVQELDLRRSPTMDGVPAALFAGFPARGRAGHQAPPNPNPDPDPDLDSMIVAQQDELPAETARLRLLTLDQVTGYRKPWREARDYLRAQGLSPTANVAGLLYGWAGYQPGIYSQKLNISLKPHWSAQQAMLTILRHQYQVMHLNEAGIIADLDTEFLHDYRVALRRSRAALTQLKGVLSATEVKLFRGRLATLARMSNRLRDLDVYLLKKEEYRQMLPILLQSGLEPLFTMLELDRRRELRKLVGKMKGSDYRKIMAQWREFISDDAPLRAPSDPPSIEGSDRGVKEGVLPKTKALEPVMLLAEKTIARSCARLLKNGRAIGPDSPDQALHELRLDCKKIRYLFEFFSDLFPSPAISPLIAQTRKLQENLGTFNDLYVQQGALRKFLAESTGENELEKEPEKLVAMTAAIGGLISLLHRKQRQVRRQFTKIFKNFDACEYRRRFCPEK